MKSRVGIVLTIFAIALIAVFSISQGLASTLERFDSIEDFKKNAQRITSSLSNEEILQIYQNYFAHNPNFPKYTDEQVLAIARQTSEGRKLINGMNQVQTENFIDIMGEVSYSSSNTVVAGWWGNNPNPVQPRIICPRRPAGETCIPGTTSCMENDIYTGGGGHACQQTCGPNGLWEDPVPCTSVLCSGQQCAAI